MVEQKPSPSISLAIGWERALDGGGPSANTRSFIHIGWCGVSALAVRIFWSIEIITSISVCCLAMCTATESLTASDSRLMSGAP